MLNNAKKTPHAFGMRCLFVMEDEEMSSYSYDPKSLKAEEFINHEEILESLDYAEKNKNNKELLRQILDKAKLAKGISHKEAAVLMQCDIPEVNEEITKLARRNQRKVLRTAYCHVCSTVFVKLLCQWMYLLSVSSQK